jgi:hypothetical protein
MSRRWILQVYLAPHSQQAANAWVQATLHRARFPGRRWPGNQGCSAETLLPLPCCQWSQVLFPVWSEPAI